MRKELLCCLLLCFLLSGCANAMRGFAEGFQSGAAPNLEQDRLRRQQLANMQSEHLLQMKNAHNSYMIEMEKINVERETAGLEPRLIKGFQEWQQDQ